MKLHHTLVAGVLAAGLLAAPLREATAQSAPEPVQQVQRFLDGLFRPGAASAAVAPSPAAQQAGKAAAAAAAATGANGKGSLEPNAAALNELRVDRQCNKVEERFDVWEKAAEYAGTHAQLRLQALLASDFEHDQLTESDRRMLRYLAYTTVWVPASVESTVGGLYARLGSSGDDNTAAATGRTQRKALDRMGLRLGELQ